MLTPKEHNHEIIPVFPRELSHSALLSTGQYLARTPQTTGNTQTFTFSGWFKGTTCEAAGHCFFTAGSASLKPRFHIFLNDNQFSVFQANSAGTTLFKYSFDWNVFSDPTAWYHLAVMVDTTAPAALDRVRVYYNGNRLVPLETSTMAAQNTVTSVNDINYQMYIGRKLHLITTPINGYASDIIFVDGIPQGIHQFGEYSSIITGLWIPRKSKDLTLGQNGFHLRFSDAANLGHDSAQENHWTVIGDPAQCGDTPTNNHCTFNRLLSLDRTNELIFSNGNRTISSNNDSFTMAMGDIPMATERGLYWECTLETLASTASLSMGAIESRCPSTNMANKAGHFSCDAAGYYADGVFSEWVNPPFFSAGDIFQFALKGNNMWIGRNGSWLEDGDPINHVNPMITGLPQRVLPFVTTGAMDQKITLNSGGTIFAFSPPTGFKPLCIKTNPEPTLLRSSTVFDITTRIGTGGDTTVSSLEFAPDFVYIKGRWAVDSWGLFDRCQGTTKYLRTNSSSAQSYFTDSLTAFNDDGYNLGYASFINKSGNSFLDLCLKSAPYQGFELIEYTGDGSSGRDISHALQAPPSFMIVKNLETGTLGWALYHSALGEKKHLLLNSTENAQEKSDIWNDTPPTSTHFTVGSNPGVNGLGQKHMAYLFADSAIFQAFSYVGNGSEDGPFVHLGGKPRALFALKNTDEVGHHFLFDSARNEKNIVASYLLPDSTDVETTESNISTLFSSQGIKITGTNPQVNGEGNLMVGLAMLESTKYSNAF
ncbi:DUF7483 domain-containing protein [Pseudodesulfovibrio piezophilus]|uniref:DUF7483 domain-containing protein n=1 Tax=Pseudodesulfovibrio piezophilus (strain DSM 21447 / JCM 15486 / C1TLV30) TaxID=1322246 RepID=M1WMI0_PSEP2|nr:LamG-like jellyroll fold domain-containing protein [Pseudodesulfovibrio piezophilus]CCH49640.1 protein of unknown function [Pseudodesulfovibrio piezophilus C1TLV30]